MKDVWGFQGAEEINVLCGYKTSSCVLANSRAGSLLCTGRCDFNNLLLSPERLELPTPSLVSGFSVSSPFLPSHSHIPSGPHTDASVSTEQLLGRAQELPERQNHFLSGAEE